MAIVGPPVLYALVAAWLFRGTSSLGMEFDEVFRVNNLVAVLYPGAQPYDQSISRVVVLGHGIPLMYKSYVSSAFLAFYAPLVAFSDTLVGIRMLDYFYTVAAAVAGFLLFRRRSYTVAFSVPLLALVSPLLYPDVTYGFVDVQHVVPLLLGAWSFRRYLRGGSRWSLGLASLLTAAAVNVSFYTAWVVAGLAVGAVILYPSVLREMLTNVRNVAALVFGALIGLFNYVYYNVAQGFPTISPLVNRVFFPDRYNKNPIDFRESRGFVAEAFEHLRYVPTLLGGAGVVVALFAVLTLGITAAATVVALRRREMAEVRLAVLPTVAVVVAFGAILVSPNTTRRGHYGMLVGLLECAFAGAVVLAVRYGPEWLRRWRVIIVPLLVSVLFSTYATASYGSVGRALRSGGEGYFSSAIFDLRDFLDENGVADDDVLQVQWGSYAQLYFLSQGEFVSPNVVFPVLGADEDKRVEIVADAIDAQGGAVLIPVYTKVPATNGVDATKLVASVARSRHWPVCTVKVFDDREGDEQLRLYRIDTAGATGPADPATTCTS